MWETMFLRSLYAIKLLYFNIVCSLVWLAGWILSHKLRGCNMKGCRAGKLKWSISATRVTSAEKPKWNARGHVLTMCPALLVNRLQVTWTPLTNLPTTIHTNDWKIDCDSLILKSMRFFCKQQTTRTCWHKAQNTLWVQRVHGCGHEDK